MRARNRPSTPCSLRYCLCLLWSPPRRVYTCRWACVCGGICPASFDVGQRTAREYDNADRLRCRQQVSRGTTAAQFPANERSRSRGKIIHPKKSPSSAAVVLDLLSPTQDGDLNGHRCMHCDRGDILFLFHWRFWRG
ncbi:hypothetical protein L211DRAFT_342849 [Terfezia boudieri ATCC MYA-4762]|uniref:Uncharacterized protein n=1 Tax=Terfezia boudieri ATCC MYA-4762 TaxID=1051890 RepID=A0A3N4LNJ2_9PEZI|nr:hypothetical protein L211DRAFT_342849 [Terfezia boudieri ATCC MYA-4762]